MSNEELTVLTDDDITGLIDEMPWEDAEEIGSHWHASVRIIERAVLARLPAASEAVCGCGPTCQDNGEGNCRYTASEAAPTIRNPPMVASEAGAVPSRSELFLMVWEQQVALVGLRDEDRPMYRAFFNHAWNAAQAEFRRSAPPEKQASHSEGDAGALPLMRAAFRTTDMRGSPDPNQRRFEMVFEFRSIEDLHKADDEWRAYIVAPIVPHSLTVAQGDELRAALVRIRKHIGQHEIHGALKEVDVALAQLSGNSGELAQGERAAFETWVSRRTVVKKYGAKLLTYSDGSYRDYRINDRWLAWQAAIAVARQQGGGDAEQYQYRIFMDGDAWCCIGSDFVDLHRSDAGFGATARDALDELQLQEGNKSRTKMRADNWGVPEDDSAQHAAAQGANDE